MSVKQETEHMSVQLYLEQPTRQPNWGPKHVRSVKELRLGVIYAHHTIVPGHWMDQRKIAFITSAPTHRLRVLELPEAGSQSVSVYAYDIICNGRRSSNRTMSLTELGLAPDTNGRWPQWDWLEDTSVSRALVLSCR